MENTFHVRYERQNEIKTNKETNHRIELFGMIGINEEEVGQHDTNDHEDKMPGLQLATNLRDDVGNRHVEEGTSREGEGDGQSRLVNLRHPKSDESSQQGGNGSGGGEESDVGEGYSLLDK